MALVALGGGAHLTSAQGAQSRAGLVVQFGDGSVRSYCIAFERESITGFDLLLKSGLNVTAEGFGGMGGLVCKIEAEGCDYPGEACVCKSYGPNGVYWSYHHLRQGKWKTSSMGAGGYRVRNGEVDGWAWSAGKPPVVRTFDQLCGAAQPRPTNTPVPPTATPRPQPSNTPKPPTATATRQPARPTGTATARAATSTPVAARPTNTKEPQVVRPSATKQVIRQVTPTRQPPLVIATSTPKKGITSTSTSMYTPTSVPTRRPTQVAPTPVPTEASPTRVDAVTPTASATQTTIPPTGTNTPIPTPTETAIQTQTSTPAAPLATNSPTQTPTPDPQPPSTDTARTISMVIGAAVIGGLLVWGGVTLATRRVGGKSRRS